MNEKTTKLTLKNIFRIFIWKVSEYVILFFFRTICFFFFFSVPKHIGTSRVRLYNVCFMVWNEDIKKWGYALKILIKVLSEALTGLRMWHRLVSWQWEVKSCFKEKKRKRETFEFIQKLCVCGGEPFIDYNLIGNFNGWARYNRINVYFRQFKTL